MNTSDINSSAINGDGITAGVTVPLGAASATLRFLMYEHDNSEMAGTITMSMDASGNLARLVLLSMAETGIVFSETAKLGEDATVPLGAVTATLEFAASADLHRIAMLDQVISGLTFAVTGDLYGRVLMTGSTGINFTASGALMQYIQRALEPVAADIVFGASATLFRYTSPGGVQSDITFDVRGLLATRVFISGGSGITFDVQGTLFNNPAGPDLDMYTMIRPYVDRTMVRES